MNPCSRASLAVWGLVAALAACEAPQRQPGVKAERLFVTPWSTPECALASPLVGAEGEVVTAAGGALRGIDAATGALEWEAVLPAPAGEQGFVTGTPALVGDGLAVVAYHTTAAGLAQRDVTTPRLRQRVAVMDLRTHAPAAGFPPLDLAARLPGNGGDVLFRADHQLARPMVVIGKGPGDRLGRAYVTTGNARDLQPWHGWLFEIDLDAWSGGAAAVRVLVTTPESDCGPEGESGSRTRICGGGLWAPSGPLVRRVGETDELVLAPGNGQLDLKRGDYANTLLRVPRGLAFDAACDASRCASSSPTEPDEACVASCRNLFVPRLLPGQLLPRPETGVCDGLGSLFDCWAKLDFQGGSTPIEVPLPSGKRPLIYPTKDGHAYLIDGDHFGTLYDRAKLVEICGTKGDPCTMNWAGMIVTQPALLGGHVAVPTFMPDSTHPAGVFGLVVDDGERPRVRIDWRFPAEGTSAAQTRFRRHPSRPLAATLPGGLEVFWVVETAPPGGRGRLVALRARDGALLADEELAGPGYRFTLPLIHAGAIYVPSCQSDSGPGTLEAFRLQPE